MGTLAQLSLERQEMDLVAIGYQRWGDFSFRFHQAAGLGVSKVRLPGIAIGAIGAAKDSQDDAARPGFNRHLRQKLPDLIRFCQHQREILL